MSLPLPALHTDVTPEPEPETDSVLARSVALRFPTLKPEGLALTGAQKCELLMDHIADTAIMRGELAELRLEAHARLLNSEKEWEEIQVSDSSLAAKERARERARPTLARFRRLARWTIDRCTEEIDRMDADYNSASRAYTILSGS